MTERVLGPTGSRSRTTRASLLLMALIGLVFGVLIGGGGIGSAASGPGVDDYSQCTDGTVDGPTPPAFLGFLRGACLETQAGGRDLEVRGDRVHRLGVVSFLTD